MDDIEVLGLLVQGDEAAGERQTWVFYVSGGGARLFVGGVGWPEDTEVPTTAQIDDLIDSRWLRLVERNGNGRTFAVTSDGRREWTRHVARQAHAAGWVDLSWTDARPLLERIYDLYREAGAPEAGVDVEPLVRGPETARQNQALIRELFRDGLLEEPETSVDQDSRARPTSKTVQMLDGWPGSAAEDALNGLVGAIDAEIEQTSDTTKRSKLIALRDSLVGAGRDLALAYFEKKVMGV
jgi:hypothetical protein